MFGKYLRNNCQTFWKYFSFGFTITENALKKPEEMLRWGHGSHSFPNIELFSRCLFWENIFEPFLDHLILKEIFCYLKKLLEKHIWIELFIEKTFDSKIHYLKFAFHAKNGFRLKFNTKYKISEYKVYWIFYSKKS